MDFNMTHLCHSEPPRLCLSVTDTIGNEYTLLLSTPFQVQTHVMPGGKEVIVLKATRPTASCLAWRVRPEESLAGHRALRGINCQEKVEQQTKLNEVSHGQKKRSQEGQKILWKLPVGDVGFFFVVLFSNTHTHTHKAHMAFTSKVTRGH